MAAECDKAYNGESTGHCGDLRTGCSSIMGLGKGVFELDLGTGQKICSEASFCSWDPHSSENPRTPSIPEGNNPGEASVLR